MTWGDEPIYVGPPPESDLVGWSHVILALVVIAATVAAVLIAGGNLEVLAVSKFEPRHRCAVCWEWASAHDEWVEHAESVHGASLTDFGYRICPDREDNRKSCPGIEHASKLPNYGTAKVPRAKPEPRPFTAKDGTVYTPIPLPAEPSA